MTGLIYWREDSGCPTGNWWQRKWCRISGRHKWHRREVNVEVVGKVTAWICERCGETDDDMPPAIRLGVELCER